MSDDRNPYVTGNDPPRMVPSVVAFVDILGYLSLIRAAEKNGTAPSFLISLHEALSAASQHLNHLDEDGNPLLPPGTDIKDTYKIRTFTDNIVIGCPIYEDAEMELGEVFWQLADFQLEMVNRGFFVRGAISIGNAYIDDLVVFGKGLLEAYEGESQDARDPRIILTSSAQKAVTHHLGYYGNSSSAPQTRDLYRDADGQFFLNYLDSIMIAEHEQGPYYELLARHKSAVEIKLQGHRDQPAYWAKYAWAASYHNFFCDQHSYFGDEHKIDLSGFQMAPSPIV